MYTKKQLEIKLSKLKLSPVLDSRLEQYPTDSSNAAWIIFKATLDGNVAGKRVIDLGTGNGIFAIGTYLMDAESVYAVDKDSAQIDVARGNSVGFDIAFETLDVGEVKGHYDTAFMNPPFGSVTPHSDQPFLSKALGISDWIYSVHNMKSAGFVKSFYEDAAEIVYSEKLDLKMPQLYGYHSHSLQIIPAIFYVVRNVR